MDKYKRKIKELEAQDAWNVRKTLEDYNKRWVNSLRHTCHQTTSINISSLIQNGNYKNIEIYITGNSFADHVMPAIKKALEDTLRSQRHDMRFMVETLDKELTKYRVKLWEKREGDVPSLAGINPDKTGVFDTLGEAKRMEYVWIDEMGVKFDFSEIEEFIDK